MRLNLAVNKQLRKRKRTATTNVLSDEPSSGEEDEKAGKSAPEEKGKTSAAPTSEVSKKPATAAAAAKMSATTTSTLTSDIIAKQPNGWRVKLYRLNADGSWDDCGTGRIVCTYREHTTTPTTNNNTIQGQQQQNSPGKDLDQWLATETGEATLVVHGEISKQYPGPRVLLRTRVLLREAYQRQGDNIITWCEPHFKGASAINTYNTSGVNNNKSVESTNNEDPGVDLALSFQDNEGCLEIWRQITQVQKKAAALQSVEVAAQVSAQHHADLQQEAEDQHAAALAEFNSNLPNPPTLQDLDRIGDAIATLQHVQQREALAHWIAQNECAYLKSLLECFPEAETRTDYGKLATLAACVKTILLLNDPALLELIVTDAGMFERVCACLEYDPDLREKGNHRWFLRERAKFRTIVPLENPTVVASIHRCFRVQYLRDTLLRPTMDESSLSTLSSLQTFTHAEVVKGVVVGDNDEGSLKDSYLLRVIKTLGLEVNAIGLAEWTEETEHLHQQGTGSPPIPPSRGALSVSNLTEPSREELVQDRSKVKGEQTVWSQYLSPQDSSMRSRRTRRRGCLSFLRELFNMVRVSLQPSEKDDFFGMICSLEIDLLEDREIPDNASQASQQAEVGSVASTNASTIKSDTEKESCFSELHSFSSLTNLLSLLANVLCDPMVDNSEKAICLELVVGIALHDPRLIRRHCLEYHTVWNNHEKARPNVTISRPEPNDRKQVLFMCPPNDLFGAFLYLLDVETDVGVLLQVTEILRVALDTDMVGEPVATFAAEEAIPASTLQSHSLQQQQPQQLLHSSQNNQGDQQTNASDQKQFLSLFFEHYMEWLVAPFQFAVLHSRVKILDNALRNQNDSLILQNMVQSFQRGMVSSNPRLKMVHPCAVRGYFAVELLSFCVRAHLYRMKFFLLKTSVLGNVLDVLRPRPHVVSGDRCLKLAALRFFRAVLSINDELYNRYIIQHNHFEPVFEAFRSNPVGDNLVSSAIIEICDFVHNEKIKSLLEHIVTKHMSAEALDKQTRSIEDVSMPYVNTLTELRQSYEASQRAEVDENGQISSPGSAFFSTTRLQNSQCRVLSGKALEDQRKFKELDQSESYFDSDEDSTPANSTSTRVTSVPPAVDEVEQVESELHRTPRMFSLAQAPLLNNLEGSKEIKKKSAESSVKVD